MHNFTYGSRIQYVTFLIALFLTLTSGYSVEKEVAINVSVNETKPTCSDASDGSIDITVSGGTAPYNYVWEGPNGYSSTEEDISNITPGNYTVTVSDNNSSTTEQINLSFQDNIPPTVITRNITVQLDDSGNATITATDIDNGSNDACGIQSVSVSPSSFTCDNIGANTVTLTVTDNNGNVSTKTETVTVEDNIAPTISCINDKTKSASEGICDYIVQGTEFDPISTDDNCEVASVTNDFNSSSTLDGAQIPNGTTIVWTITDTSSNTNTCSFTVTVNDTQAPAMPQLDPITSECTITVTPPTTIDNCDGELTATTGDDLTFQESGSVFWSFTDAAGNKTGPIEQSIIIDDTVAPIPVAGSLARQTINGCEISSISDLNIPTATDNCAGEVQGTLGADFEFPFIFTGVRTITWQYWDENENLTTQEQEIEMVAVEINGGSISGIYESVEYESQIDFSSCGEAISVNLELTGEIGNIIQWEKFAENEGSWVPINDNDNFYTASFAVGALESTKYRVLIQEGTCINYSDIFYIRALPTATAPTVTNLDPDNIYCLGESMNLRATSNHIVPGEAIPGGGGDFNLGQLNTQDPDGWLVDGEAGGFTAGGDAKKPRNWSGTNNHEFGGIEYDSQEGKFAIAQGNFSDPKYAGANPTIFESPIIDLSDALSAYLKFDQAYRFSNGDTAKIEISIDGGTSYQSLEILHLPGDGDQNWHDDNIDNPDKRGTSTETEYYFNTDDTSINLENYLGEERVRIRWVFEGTSDESVWVMDNISLEEETYVPTEIEWTIGIGDPDENPIATGETEADYSWVTNIPGYHQFGGTSLVNSCRTYTEEGTDLIDIYVSSAYPGEDIIYTPEECGNNLIQLNAYDNSKSANQNAAKGAFPSIPENCTACDNPGSGSIGTWTSTRQDGECGEGAFSDINDPDATFSGGAGTYILTWTVDGCSQEITVTITDCKYVNFDGVNDYIDFQDSYDLEGAFSLEVWVKPNSTTGTQTVFSKRDAESSGSGYDLSIKAGIVSFNWNGTGSIASPHQIAADRWYHLALTHSAEGEYRLYIDGILMKSIAGGAPGSNEYRALLGAMDRASSNIPSNHYNGWIEELRIWKKKLNTDQLHLIMNQRINKVGSNEVTGEILPITVANLSWSNLLGYYRLDDISCGYVNPFSVDGTTYVGVPGRLINITTPQDFTAPLPYISNSNGSWRDANTWLHSNVWDPPNSEGIDNQDINWNIAITSHDIFSTPQDIYMLGLLSQSGELLMEGSVASETGNGLTITHYLKLDGTINLEGESQLVQTEGSILDEASAGYLDRDQQGTENSFNYNYWTSPVSLIQTANNSGYKISEVLLDGTDPLQPKVINFNYNHTWADGSYTGAKRISSYWLHTFKGTADNYFEWHQFEETELLSPGIGYSMKGTKGYVPLNNKQNYTFRGKPNNGDITVSVGTDQNLLTGNPYPSAIDAYQFIDDNAIVDKNFNGSIYFWDHFGKEDTHYLEEYVGGYAVMNKSGSVSSASSIDSRINNNNTSNDEKPGQYIPVGQAFFINTIGATNPQSITYKNKYRAFVPESTDDSHFHMQEDLNPKKTKENKSYKTDTRYKIRLKFESPKGYHRQILVAADANTSKGFDLGYDAPLIENNVEDMYWMIGDTEFVIQGVPNFNLDQVLPIGIKISEPGEFTIKIDELENIRSDFKIYLKDLKTEEYFNISEKPYTTTTEETGYFNDRYEVVFREPFIAIPEEEEKDLIEDPALSLQYYKDTDEIALLNPDRMAVDFVELYSISGQKIKSFRDIPTRESILLSIEQKLSSAVYIVKVYSGAKIYSEKVIITK